MNGHWSFDQTNIKPLLVIIKQIAGNLIMLTGRYGCLPFIFKQSDTITGTCYTIRYLNDTWIGPYVCVAWALWSKSRWADTLHFGSAWQFLPIFVHPNHLLNSGHHRCKDFHTCNCLLVTCKVNTLWFGDFYAHLDSMEPFNLIQHAMNSRTVWYVHTQLVWIVFRALAYSFTDSVTMFFTML